jgi:hypothetical protein
VKSGSSNAICACEAGFIGNACDNSTTFSTQETAESMTLVDATEFVDMRAANDVTGSDEINEVFA